MANVNVNVRIMKINVTKVHSLCIPSKFWTLVEVINTHLPQAEEETYINEIYLHYRSRVNVWLSFLDQNPFLIKINSQSTVRHLMQLHCDILFIMHDFKYRQKYIFISE